MGFEVFKKSSIEKGKVAYEMVLSVTKDLGEKALQVFGDTISSYIYGPPEDLSVSRTISMRDPLHRRNTMGSQIGFPRRRSRGSTRSLMSCPSTRSNRARS